MSEPTEPAAPTEPAEPAYEDRRPRVYDRRRRPLSVQTVGVILAVISLMALGLSGWAAWRYRDHAVCQAAVSDNLYERTRILAEVGAAEREAERRRAAALDDLLTDPVVRKSPRTAVDQRHIDDLYDAYGDAVDQLRVEHALADKARAENPVPAPPSDTCDP
jgi:hypothetical protein